MSKIFFTILTLILALSPLAVLAEDISTSTSAYLSLTVEPIGYIPPELAPYLGLWGEKKIPVIYNVRIYDITGTSAWVSWDTDTPCTSELYLGKTLSYELGFRGDLRDLFAAHKVKLTDLEPGATYYFYLRAQDSQRVTVISSGYSFTTLTSSDTTAPADVMDFSALPGNRFINLTWKNPLDSDFAGARILRSTEFYPNNPQEYEKLGNSGEILKFGNAVLVYDGVSEEFNDVGLTNGVRYFYTIFTYDFSGNFSSGAIASAVPAAAREKLFIPPLIEIPTFLTLADMNFFVAHDSLEIKPNEQSELKVLAGTVLTSSIKKEKLPPGLKTIILRVGGSSYLLKEHVNKINDSALAPGSVSGPAYQVKHQVPEYQGLYPMIVLVLIYKDGGRSEVRGTLVVEEYGKIKAQMAQMAGDSGQINTDNAAVAEAIVAGAEVRLYQKSKNASDEEIEKSSQPEAAAPVSGADQPLAENIEIKSNVNGEGREKITLNGQLPGASGGGSQALDELFKAGAYFQFNPQITNQGGEYGWMAPNGEYFLEIDLKNYEPVKTPVFTVRDNLINHQIFLKLPTPSYWQRFGLIEFLKFIRNLFLGLALALGLLVFGFKQFRGRRRLAGQAH